jgi:hypothetical protein
MGQTHRFYEIDRITASPASYNTVSLLSKSRTGQKVRPESAATALCVAANLRFEVLNSRRFIAKACTWTGHSPDLRLVTDRVHLAARSHEFGKQMATRATQVLKASGLRSFCVADWLTPSVRRCARLNSRVERILHPDYERHKTVARSRPNRRSGAILVTKAQRARYGGVLQTRAGNGYTRSSRLS